MKIMVKQGWAKAGCLALTALAAIILTTCQTLGSVFKEPKFSLYSMNLTNISFSGVDLRCRVNVENPNPVDIPFPQIDWDFFVNSNSFVKGVIKNDRSIKSRTSTLVDIPLSMTYANLINTFKSLSNSKEADYRIALAAKFTLPVLGSKIFRLEHTGKFPVLRIPSLSFKGITVKNVSLSRVDFEMSWELENQNSFAIDVKELTYNFIVNNSQWVTGKVPGAPRLQPDKKTVIPLGFSINNLALVKSITEIITKGSNITYDCRGNVNLGGGLPGLSDLKMPFNFTGTTKLRK
jgi:LEA14-like dessication related protein